MAGVSTVLTPVIALTRNRCMVRVLAAWLLAVVDEYATWTAVLVYAFERHGTTGAALAAFGQLLPAALCAPAVAALADRRSPTWLLRGGFAVQLAGLALAAVAMTGGAPEILAYAGAVLAATAVVAVRPAMSLVVPGVARNTPELGAANAVVGWLECVGTILAGLLVGGVLTVGGPGWVLAAAAGVVVVALVATTRVHVTRMRVTGQPPDDGDTVAGAVRSVVAAPRLRVLVAVLTAGAVVVGALDVLFVVLAGDVLDRGAAWAGYLTTALGTGGVLAVGVTVVVTGRGRLGRPVVLATLVLAGALAATSTVSTPAPVVALVVVVGAAHAVLDVGARALLQRAVPATLTGRVFGLVEAATMGGMAAGALLVPALTALGGPSAALLGVAALGPLALLVGGPAVRRLDDGRREPLVELSLLRQSPTFAGVGLPVLRELAASAEVVAVAAGSHLAGGVLVVAGGVAEQRTGTGGPPITRRRGDLVTGPARACTAVTAYRLDPALLPAPASPPPVQTPARSRNPRGVGRNPAASNASVSADDPSGSPSAFSICSLPSRPSRTARARASAAACNRSGSSWNDSRVLPPRST